LENKFILEPEIRIHKEEARSTSCLTSRLATVITKARIRISIIKAIDLLTIPA
jgi:hypothetical protein